MEKSPNLVNSPSMVIGNIVDFVSEKLGDEFPEINGVGIGIVADLPEDFLRLSPEEKRQKIRESLGIVIYLRQELTEERKQEIRRRVAEKFISFEDIGEVVAL